MRYITVNRDELRIKDIERYSSFYRGLTYAQRHKYGVYANRLKADNLTWLVILMCSLTGETPIEIKDKLIPGTQKIFYSRASEYVADMNVLLGAITGGADVALKNVKKSRSVLPFEMTARQYPKKVNDMRMYYDLLREAEESNSDETDLASSYMGKVFSEVFAYDDAENSEELSRMGFYAGKFLYLLDSLKNLSSDLKSHRYNIWRHYMNRKDFDALAENILVAVASEMAASYEKLDIKADKEILDNIVYDGIWTSYRELKKEEEESRRINLKIPDLKRDPWKSARPAINSSSECAKPAQLSAAEYFDLAKKEYEEGANIRAMRHAKLAHDMDGANSEYREFLNSMTQVNQRYRERAKM